MHTPVLPRLVAVTAAVAAMGLAACGADNTPIGSTIAPTFAVGDVTTSTVEAGKIKICKTGNADGVFTLGVTADPGASPSVVSTPVTVPTGTCKVVVEDVDEGVGAHTVITETSAGLVSATATDINLGTSPYESGATSLFLNQFHGWTVTFENNVEAPPPPGDKGCSPGYWKNHTAAGKWPAPYTPNEQFSAVFENAFPGKSLLTVLSTGGGGLTALGRQTVGALLNAASIPGFEMTPQQVIAAFNAVYPGTKAQYTALQAQFEGLTDVDGRTCPLN